MALHKTAVTLLLTIRSSSCLQVMNPSVHRIHPPPKVYLLHTASTRQKICPKSRNRLILVHCSPPPQGPAHPALVSQVGLALWHHYHVVAWKRCPSLLDFVKGNPPVTGWFPSQKDCSVKPWFSLLKQTAEQTFESPVICDAMTLTWRH